MELAVGVAVEVGQDDAIGLYPLACEQVDDLVSARADLGMDQDGRAGLAAADGGCHQPTFLEHADALIGSARLDHARARRIWRRRAEPVVGVHPTLQVGDDPLRQQLDGRGAHPVTFRVMSIAVVAGRRHDVHTGGFRDRPHLRRTPAETDRRHLHDRMQTAARRIGHFFDCSICVLEVLAR